MAGSAPVSFTPTDYLGCCPQRTRRCRTYAILCSVQPGCHPTPTPSPGNARSGCFLTNGDACNRPGKHPASPYDLSALGSHLSVILVPPACGGNKVSQRPIKDVAPLNSRNVSTPINGLVVESFRRPRHAAHLALSQLATVTNYKCLIYCLLVATLCSKNLG